MKRIIAKFGGTSLATAERIRHAAQRIAAIAAEGNQVAVVVSAQAGETNALLEQCRVFHPTQPSQDAYDIVTATGEQVSAGLMVLALRELGIQAEGFAGWQIPIVTDNNFGSGRIQAVYPEAITRVIERGVIPVVAGFQGVTASGAITTLGRGGSDLTAVALAAALHADRCDIFTDVDGVYTADPNLVPNAQKLDKISYSQMLQLAEVGAKVMQAASIEHAALHKVLVRVVSSFQEIEGTLIGDFEPDARISRVCGLALYSGMTRVRIDTGATLNAIRAHVNIIGHALDDAQDMQHQMQTSLQNAGISIEGISCTPDRLSFVVANDDAQRALQLLHTACGLDR